MRLFRHDFFVRIEETVCLAKLLFFASKPARKCGILMQRVRWWLGISHFVALKSWDETTMSFVVGLCIIMVILLRNLEMEATRRLWTDAIKISILTAGKCSQVFFEDYSWYTTFQSWVYRDGNSQGRYRFCE